MLRSPNPRNGRCLCGLRLTHHFDHRNVKLTCEEAAEEHPWAGGEPMTTMDLLHAAYDTREERRGER